MISVYPIIYCCLLNTMCSCNRFPIFSFNNRQYTHTSFKCRLQVNAAFKTNQLSDIMMMKKIKVRTVGRMAIRKKKNGNLDLGEMKPLRPPHLENTFQLAPSQQFVPHCVEGIVKDIMLSENLANVIYNADIAPCLVIKMADEIKEKLKLLYWKRYKFVVHTLIGQNLSQHFMMASRCLWSEDVDNFVVVKYNNSNLFVICSVFATYLE